MSAQLAADILRLPEALADAKEAFACHMDKIGCQTFLATFVLAGVEAAKEESRPPITNPILCVLVTASESFADGGFGE